MGAKSSKGPAITGSNEMAIVKYKGRGRKSKAHKYNPDHEVPPAHKVEIPPNPPTEPQPEPKVIPEPEVIPDEVIPEPEVMDSKRRAFLDQLAEAATLYKRSQDMRERISRVLRRSLLEKALRIYNAQIIEASRPELKTIYRNIGMTNLRLAEFLDEAKTFTELRLVGFHLAEAVVHFGKALRIHGGFESDWALGILEKIQDSVIFGLRNADRYIKAIPNHRQRYAHMDGIGNVNEDEKFLGHNIKIKCALAKSRYFYNMSILKMEFGDFKGSLQFLEYSREEMQVALESTKYLKSEDLTSEICVIEEELFIQLCVCQSVQLRSQADSLLEDHLINQESPNMAMLWSILDMFKQAILLTREKDLEHEALLLARIGRIYDRILKMSWKAKEYYKRTFDLAQVLLPKDLNKFEWFREAKQVLERLQKNVILEEQRRKEAEKAPILKKLKPQLDKIKKIADKGVSKDTIQKLLIYVYDNHPPKVKGEFDQKNLNPENAKKMLLTAITHYHPDRQANQELEWKVLCEEITKYLTHQYECLKGM